MRINRVLVLVCALAALGFSLAAFGESEYGFYGGLSSDRPTNIPTSLGGSISGVSGAATRGAMLGFERKKELTPFLYFQNEINYVQRGLSLNANVAGTPVSETIHTDYLEVPLLLRAQANIGFLHPYLIFGPSVGVAVNRSVGATNGATGESLSIDASSAVNPFDAGLNGGAGIELKLGDSVGLEVEGRYYYGLTDIDPARSGVFHRGAEMRAGITWRFN
jgi:hypothetical protein